ncbi:creatinine amidohydrolase [Enterovirga rhinocerotis]|uniref:Creatinine amidohydrolase n=2 Tax=Enterovirga rhinocerotis TaxID=1339210 RepID=A0A4V6PZE5_9HYPH|nr:creatinine amidohydrolase [Enterovirga rhinocerotis]
MKPEERCLEKLTTLEVSDLIAGGARRIIVPCGAVEQHGPHMALSMDARHAEALAGRVAMALGQTLIAPTIRVGCSPHHLDFSGTVSLAPETFAAICRDYCVSLARHGFNRILFFSGHIGNFPHLEAALPMLNEAVAGRAQVVAFHDPDAWLDGWRRAVARAGGDPERVGGHADLAETSIMLEIDPSAVRMPLAAAGRLGPIAKRDLDVIWRDGFASVSPNGILGDARGATPSIGQACLDEIANLLTSFFRQGDRAGVGA